MTALALLWLATMVVLPARFLARAGWNKGRIFRCWVVGVLFGVAGAVPFLLLSISGFGAPSPMWMYPGAGAGALIGIGLAERASGNGFGPTRALAFGALGWAFSSALVWASSLLLEPSPWWWSTMGAALISPTTFAYAVGKPLVPSP